MLRKHFEKIAGKFQKPKPSKNPAENLPTETVTTTRRGFLQGIAALGVLASVPALEGCEEDPSWSFSQNIDLSQVQELEHKGSSLEIKTLSKDEYYEILQRQWALKNINLDPRAIFSLPKNEVDPWEFNTDSDAISRALTDGGYIFDSLDHSSDGESHSLSFHDEDGGTYEIFRVFSSDLHVRVVTKKSDEIHGVSYDTKRYNTKIEPANKSHLVLTNEDVGRYDTLSSFGFAEETVTVLARPLNPLWADDPFELSKNIYVGDENIEIATKEQFWEYLAQCTDGAQFITMLKTAPVDFLEIESEVELLKIIKTLPNNNPAFFTAVIGRIVAFGGDKTFKQEYKAPMQTINDGVGDCDDYTILNAYWAKLNGFKVTSLIWRGSRIGKNAHVNLLLTNPKTGEQFFCDNTLVYSGAVAKKALAEYEKNYREKDVGEL